MTVLDSRKTYKPFHYPWAYEAYKAQQSMHWLPEEVPLREDVRDWNYNLNEDEKNLLTQIFRFFTQADVAVAEGYLHKYIPLFGHHPELAMMMSSFAAMEANHIDSYSLLLETVGMPQSEYSIFMEYEEMANKYDYLQDTTLDPNKKEDIARGLAIYSAFTEGLQLFSSFIILLNFSRFNKMKGMGQIVTWSIRDESLHVQSMIKLYHEFTREFPEIWTDKFKATIYQACRDIVELEDAFIDLAFDESEIEGVTAEEVKQYIRYIADRRLLQLGLKPNYEVKDNPIPWVDSLLNGVEHTNFFENRATEYSKGLVKGWDEVWGDTN